MDQPSAERLLETLAAEIEDHDDPGRPFVTPSYAQSLDGCISGADRKKLRLSGGESLVVTHNLRALHDAILIGINTVLSDDPLLIVRHARGPHPQPVILDSRLRFPLQARLLQENPRPPWIITCGRVEGDRQSALETTGDPDKDRQSVLEGAGARILPVSPDDNGRVSIPAALKHLKELGIRSLMVEGGGSVITSFLALGLVDRIVIMVAPVIIGGLHAAGKLYPENLPRFAHLSCLRLGDDLLLTGR